MMLLFGRGESDSGPQKMTGVRDLEIEEGGKVS